ncbi:hypothetical protein GCM10010413_37780 [Promicromonospora sukumoe]|uniref:Uncharacterized protein n=1 Tax=Promicromonospora sukumoe TaxID=88382 RepID=A0A7W3PDG3_9MICO|nr:hypothetical protein [Promicromonospora sukumoe]MBA8807716.1 hypothetical protein [Promicromonospora sukumoe]
MTDDAATLSHRMVRAVEDDPVRRRALAAAVYDDRSSRHSTRRYRRAELSFMDWQLRRGVLAPLNEPRPGSPWWRAVNARLLRDTWEARHLVTGATGQPSGPAVVRWLAFLDHPTPQSWYRAHNTSISYAYLDYRELAHEELPLERFFMDVTLARVLFVHSMLLNPRLALGRYCWPLGRLVGDPRSRSVDSYLSLRNVLPNEYPLQEETIEEVLDAENFWGRLIDYGVLLPRVQEVYEFAADDLSHNHLRDFIRDGLPAYAWLQDRADVWTQRRSRRLGSVIRRLTA